MIDPLLRLPGAVEFSGSGVAAHFGAPLIEQRELEAGNAVVDLGHHGVVLVEGADRLSWLHAMTSQSLSELRPGESVESLLLDGNGRIERVLRIVDDGERAYLLVDAGEAEPLIEYLNRMRFALRVEVTDASERFSTVLAFEGGTAVPELRSLGAVAEWRDPWAAVTPGGIQYARGEHAGQDWGAVSFVFERERLESVAAMIRSGSARAAGLMALDALEIRAWRPTRHGEVDTRTVPHELDWLRTAVHLTKGCYRGQETVAKVHNLGHPPRRLVLLHLDGSSGLLPEAGALVFLSGEAGAEGARPVGRVTRAALHHEWGGVALALLKRTVVEDAPLELLDAEGGIIAAAQEVIVPSDAGGAVELPRLRRL